MYFYQYALLAGFTCLLFSRKTRFAASVFLLGWIIYLSVIFDFSGSTYYAASATIEMCIGYALNKRFRLVSLLNYCLMSLNIYGFMVHMDDAGRDIYIYLYAIISITQFLFLLARALPNGINRLPAKHPVVRAVNFDSRKAHDIMYKNTPKKGKNR